MTQRRYIRYTDVRRHAVPGTVQRHPRRWNDNTSARNLTSIDRLDGTLLFGLLRRTLDNVFIITFLLWDRVWEVNVHLLRTFTDSPDLTVTNGIAFRPDERYKR